MNVSKNILKEGEIAILILSCDKYKELWEPFFHHFFSVWPDCPYKIYLLNNIYNYNHKRVHCLQVGNDISWSESLYNGLLKISEKRIFFIYEDCFISKIDTKQITSFFIEAVNNNYLSLMLRPSLFVTFWGKNIPVLVPKEALNRNSLFCNFVCREHLFWLLDKSENAWDFELSGNSRSKNYDYYSVKRPCIKFMHGIIKGRWLYFALKQLEHKGFAFNYLNKSYSKNKTLVIFFKTFIYEIYYRLMPINVLIKIEKFRKSK